MQKLETNDLQPLVDLINAVYQGNLEEVRHDLNRSIYLLHFLPEESFNKDLVLDTCFLLNAVSDMFYEIDVKHREAKPKSEE